MSRRPLVILGLVGGAAAALAALSAQAPSRRLVPAPGGPAVASPASTPAQPAAARSPRNANYSIDVRLDHASKTLTGRAVLTWRNTSSRPATEMPFHLYYNAWRNSRSTWMREALLGRADSANDIEAGDWGWIDVTAVRLLTNGMPTTDLSGSISFVAPDDGNADDRTVMNVTLPAAVLPGASIALELTWTSRVPRTFSRTGTVGDFYFIAQWFPKIGVLEDDGWNCHQFHAGTEFFADYGVYDVRLTVPKGWVVGATGREVLRAEHGDGTATHTYHAEDVHDFAWTTSPDYVAHEARFEHPTLPPVDLRLLMQPEHAGQEARYLTATRAALQWYGEWFGPYPYGHLTIVDPAYQGGAGGMEYPTLFTGGSRWLTPQGVSQPEGVTVHEAGHQFWYGLVGNNEFEHAWLDEGLNTYATARAVEATDALRTHVLSRRFFGGFVPWAFRDVPLNREVDGNGLAGYRPDAESDVPSTPSYRYHPGTGGSLSYSKTALWMNTLERHMGWPTFQRVLSTFFSRWVFKHPTPRDFFAVVNEVSGKDYTWFFDEVYRSSNTFDYGVDLVSSDRTDGAGFEERDGRLVPIASAGASPAAYRTTVVVRRHGEAVFPVDVEVRFQGGERVVERWNGRDRWKAFTYVRPVEAESAVVDPSRVLLLDINAANNSYVVRSRAAGASTRWSYRWTTWLQHTLLTWIALL